MDINSYRPICQGGKEAFGLFERSLWVWFGTIGSIKTVVLTAWILQRKQPRLEAP